MSRQIDHSQPLSDEDRKYLQQRGRIGEIQANDLRHGKVEEMSEEERAEAERQAFFESAGQRTPALMDNSIIAAQQEEIERTRQEGEDASAEAYGPYGEYDPDDVAYVEQCTVEELKEQLKQRGKSTSGNKPDLQVRLLDVLRDESAQADSQG